MKKVIPFQQFLEFFSECPSCHKPNEEEYIKRFYMSDNQYDQIIMKRLVELIMSNKLKGNTKIGMLCCNCFREKYPSGSGRPVYIEFTP